MEKDTIEVPQTITKEVTLSDITAAVQTEATAEEIIFLKKIMKTASQGRKKHIKKAKVYKRWNNVLNTVASIMSVVVGSSGIGSTLLLDTSDEAFPILFTISFITLVSGIISSIHRSLNFETKANKRKDTASDFNSIVTKIAQFLSTPGADRKDVEIFTNSIVIEMNIIDEEQEL